MKKKLLPFALGFLLAALLLTAAFLILRRVAPQPEPSPEPTIAPATAAPTPDP